MKLTILGNGSALPAFGRHPSAQVLEHNGKYYLIDCGEGTQMRLQDAGLSPFKIDHIFISHLHGDHYFGLVALVSSLSLLARTKPLKIYGPPELEKILKIQLPWDLGFPLEFYVLNTEQPEVILQTRSLSVRSFPVVHSVPTCAFRFQEVKRKRILIPQKAREFEIPSCFFSQLTDGEDYLRKDGTRILNNWVTQAGQPEKVYVYAADTAYAEHIHLDLAGADLLYHETTYLNEDIQKAETRLHSTTHQAARTASLAGVKTLLIGHFSSKYKELDPFLTECLEVFPTTILSLEGESYEI